MSTRSRFRIAAVMAALLLVVPACGDDDEDAQGAPNDAPAAEQPPGEPIVLAQWGPGESLGAGTEMYAAAEAAVQTINAEGGIEDPAGGENRPLELVTCEIPADQQPEFSQRCARDAIEAEVAAITGKYFGDEGGTQAVLDEGIPVVSILPNTTADYTHELAFPMSGGAATMGVALAAALQDAGVTTVAAALADTPSAREIPQVMGRILENGEDDMVEPVYYPLDPAADVSSFAAQITDQDPDGVAVVHTPDGTVRMIRALRDAGYEGEIAVAGFNLLPPQIETLGDRADGIIVASSYAAATSTSDEAIEEFNTAMDEYAPDAERSELAVGAFVSVRVIADALEQAETLDSAGVAAALQGLEVDNGAAPPYVLGEQGIELVPLPRVPRDTVQFQVVEGGEVVPSTEGEFFRIDG